MPKFPKEYKEVNVETSEDIFTPHYRFDSHGSLIMPFGPYQSIVFATKPGSTDVGVGTRSPSNAPLDDPEAIKTGYLHLTTAMKAGPKLGWIAQMAGGDAEYPFAYFNETTGEYKFYVDKSGNVVMTGTITATAGYIGGWLITATAITASGASVGMSSAVTGDNDIRFWAGNATPASANFVVYENGLVVAGALRITGLDAGSEPGIQEWQLTSEFSSTDYRIVAWGAGLLTLMDGTIYNIGANNSGNLTDFVGENPRALADLYYGYEPTENQVREFITAYFGGVT